MIHTIACFGAGTIGHAVAGHFALHGKKVRLYDPNTAAIQNGFAALQSELQLFAEEGLLPPCGINGVLANITVAASVPEAMEGANYALENVPENLELKQRLFCEMEAASGGQTVLSSNTSSLTLADITARLSARGKARSMVCHWYNPGHIMPIIELSFFGNMPKTMYGAVEALYLETGKQPVKVLRDVPGLVANRIQHAVAREVFWMIENGVASAEDIDRAIKFGPAFRYATTGQLEMADFGGLDAWLRAAVNLWPEISDAKTPSALLSAKVAEGKLGVKSGEGFFSYPAEAKIETSAAFHRRLIRQWKASEGYR